MKNLKVINQYKTMLSIEIRDKNQVDVPISFAQDTLASFWKFWISPISINGLKLNLCKI